MEVKALNAKFNELFGNGELQVHHFFAPGCVKLIGDHVDYNGGSVLMINLPMGISISIRERKDRILQLKSTSEPKEIQVDLKNPVNFNPLHGWGNYPLAVVKYLLMAEMSLPGADILFSGNLPPRQGLASSAALEVGTGFALMHLMGKEPDMVALALLSHHAHNEFFADYSGISAHFSIANGKKGHAIQLNCQTMAYDFLAFDPDPFELLVLTTGELHEGHSPLSDERKEECFRALMKLKGKKEVKYLCDATFSDVDEILEDETLKARARHVIWENQYVFEAAEALEEKDWVELGESFDASHFSLAGDFEVSSEEIDLLVDAVRIIDGCAGARMTGDAESGSVIALLLKENFYEFKTIITERFEAMTSLDVKIYRCSANQGIHILS